LTGFVQAAHFANLLIYLAVVFLSMIFVARFKLSSPWLAGLILLTLPVLVGHSFMNTKDIPTSAIYTLFTFSLIILVQTRRNLAILFIVSAVFGGFLVSTKMVFLPAVLIELILAQCLRNYIGGMASLGPCKLTLSILLQASAALIVAYIVTPPAWLNPIIYAREAFSLSSRFSQGGGCTYLLAKEFCLGIPHYDTLLYILSWTLVHIPLIALAGLVVFCLRLFKNTQSFDFFNLLNSQDSAIILLLILQAALVPAMAVAGNSNLYDADRQFLFIYPPLAIISSVGLGKTFTPGYSNRSALLLFNLGFIAPLLSIRLLHPYQYTYINEPFSFLVSSKDTSLHYWAFSATEAVQQSVLNGGLPLQPVVRGGIPEPPPLAYAVRSMGGRTQDDLSVPELHFAWRNPNDFEEKQIRLDRKDNCKIIHKVNRRQLLGPTLTLSTLYRCE